MGALQTDADKLTPAARQALMELVEDYQMRLIRSAVEAASRLGEVREVSVRDVMEGLSAASKQQQRSRSARSRILRAYVALGLLVGMAGVGMMVGRRAITEPFSADYISLSAAFAGFIVAAAAYVAIFIRKRQKEGIEDLESVTGPGSWTSPAHFAALWSNIEILLRQAAANQLGESMANAPIFVLAHEFARRGMLSREESNRFRQLLDLRNGLVHGVPENDATPVVLSKAVRDAQRLSARIVSLAHQERIRHSRD